MEKIPDMTVQVAGLTFKNPIVVASSECAANLSVLKNWTNRNIGGIVTKTYTSPPEFRIRVRPYQFPLNKFGKAYTQGGCLFSLAAPHVEDREAVKTHVSQMARHCKASSVVLVASFFEDPPILKSREKHPYTTPPNCPYIPKIDEQLCTHCGICETTCIYNVFTVDKNKSRVFINADKCWSCGFCVGICPSGAIELRDKKSKDNIIWNNQGLAKSFQ